MTKILTARVDSKGRLLLPKKVREQLDVKAGDTLFLRLRGRVLHLAKPENPFGDKAEYGPDTPPSQDQDPLHVGK